MLLLAAGAGCWPGLGSKVKGGRLEFEEARVAKPPARPQASLYVVAAREGFWPESVSR
jgi:hypothetical protein